MHKVVARSLCENVIDDFRRINLHAEKRETEFVFNELRSSPLANRGPSLHFTSNTWYSISMISLFLYIVTRLFFFLTSGLEDMFDVYIFLGTLCLIRLLPVC